MPSSKEMRAAPCACCTVAMARKKNEERKQKKKGAEQRNKMTFVWVQPRVCLCSFKKAREGLLCVSQNTCSSGNIQRAARVSPVHPVIISSRDRSTALLQPALFDTDLFIFLLSFFLRSFFFFPPKNFCSRHTRDVLSSAACKMYTSNFINYYLFLSAFLPSAVVSARFLFLPFFFFLSPRRASLQCPHATSIPV